MIAQQFLQKELNTHPRIGWQIDAFGLSTGYARLARDVGFDAMFFSRVDIAEKIEMRAKKRKSAVWRPHEENFGHQKDILALNMDQGSVLGSYCWPAGFWVDSAYKVDAPVILNRKDANYDFEGKVRAFYEGMLQHFTMEKTNHAFRPFGCDMSHIDASINFKISDALISTWNRLGFNETMELLYSTPSRFVQELSKINNNEWNKTGEVWPIRRDDMFPYAQNPDQFWTGYYTTRPHIKKNIRDLTRALHSSLRLTAQQVLRQDLDSKARITSMMTQFNVLDVLGNSVHHDAITGTSPGFVMGDFNDKAREFKSRILEYTSHLLIDKIAQHHNVKVSSLHGSLEYWQTHNKFTSPFSHYGELLITVKNPSIQDREELIEL